MTRSRDTARKLQIRAFDVDISKLPERSSADILSVGVEAASADNADVAQLAEQLFCKQPVAGSSPIVGSGGVFFRRVHGSGQLPEWTIGPGFKPGA